MTTIDGKRKPGDLEERIRLIEQSGHLDEDAKTRLIAELLPGGAGAGDGLEPGRLALAWLVSFLLPVSGFFIGMHYVVKHQDEGYRPAAACFALTLASLLASLWLLRVFLLSLAGRAG